MHANKKSCSNQNDDFNFLSSDVACFEDDSNSYHQVNQSNDMSASKPKNYTSLIDSYYNLNALPNSFISGNDDSTRKLIENAPEIDYVARAVRKPKSNALKSKNLEQLARSSLKSKERAKNIDLSNLNPKISLNFENNTKNKFNRKSIIYENSSNQGSENKSFMIDNCDFFNLFKNEE